MFLLASLSVLGVVALGPQVVLGSFKFNLSPVVQCEPVILAFSGSDSNNHSVPTTLTILPLLDNAVPIDIAIPNGASNSTGIRLTFIPLPANTEFIASLDDLQGPSAKVSDVTNVSPSNNTTDTNCVGSSPSSTNFYQFDDVLNQCETFSVKYTTAVAPNITAFSPRGGATSIIANDSSDAPSHTALFTMNLPREDEVVLLFDDGNGHLQNTKLIAIGGDSSSSTFCLRNPKSSSSASESNSQTKKASTVLPQAAIIGIAVGASVVGFLAILLLLYVLRTRRRRQRVKGMEFDPALLNRRWPPDEKKVNLYDSPPSFIAPSFTAPALFSGDDYVRDPIYTDEKYSSSIMSDARTSIGSWNQFVPDDQRSPRTRSWNQFAPDDQTSQRTQSVISPQRPTSSISRTSMDTVDVQNILQMATVHRDRSSRVDITVQGGPTPPTPQPSTAGTAMTTFNVAKPAVARLVSLRRNRTTEPDMPVSAISRNDSASAAAFTGVLQTYGSASYVTFGDSDDDLSTTPANGHLDASDSGVDGIGGFPVPAFRRTSNQRDTMESWGNVIVR